MYTDYLDHLNSISSEHKYPTFFKESSIYDSKNKYSLSPEDIYSIKIEELSKKDKKKNNGIYYDIYEPNHPVGKKIQNIAHVPNLNHHNNSNVYRDDKINNVYNKNKFMSNYMYGGNNSDLNIDEIIRNNGKNVIFYILVAILFTQFITIVTLLCKNNSNNDLIEKLLLFKNNNYL